MDADVAPGTLVARPMTRDEDLEDALHHAQEWTRLRDDSRLARLLSRINLADDYTPPTLLNPKLDRDRGQHSDRANRAVAEQVLDPRIRMILLKMINQNAIYQVNGCVSTGKEANVYHALTDDHQHRAIKIYKSTILTFKNRDQYVTGEYRFRHGYSRGNPRKMVQLWAEKEMRNLKRLRACGLPCPEPLLLKLQVLVMSFVGDEQGWPAPRLKDAQFGDAEAAVLYDECVRLLRRLYQECGLVHADFSEYNLLCHRGHVVVIDVSQAVEVDHPHALEFLRADCMNILRFFRARGLHTLTLQQLFDFVVQKDLTPDALDEHLRRAHAQTAPATDESQAPDAFTERYRAAQGEAFQRNDEQIFLNSYIPRTLDDVYDAERDVQLVQQGRADELIYQRLARLSVKADTPPVNTATSDRTRETGAADETDSDSDSATSDDDTHDGSMSEDGGPAPRLRDMSPEERRAWRKANKAAVKEEKRARRKTKLKKHLKRRRATKQAKK